MSGNNLFVNGTSLLQGSATFVSATIPGGAIMEVVDTTESGNKLTVEGGMTVDGTLQIGDAAGVHNGNVELDGSQTIDGSGEILFGGNTGNVIHATNSTDDITFGPALTIEGKNGIIDGAFAYSPSGQPPANQYTFEGTVEDDSGGDISIGSSNGYSYIASVTTSGTIEASNGGAVTIFDPSARFPGTWDNSGTINIKTGGTFGVAANPFSSTPPSYWTNTGTIDLIGGTLNLGGSFTQASMGTFTRSGGTVNLIGQVTGNLTLNEVTGPWNFGRVAGSVGPVAEIYNGTIDDSAFYNGTIAAPPVPLTQVGDFTFDNVTIAAGSTVPIVDTAESGVKLTVMDGLTVDGTLQIGDAAGVHNGNVELDGSQTIDGSGEILFGGNTGNVIHATNSTDDITFGPALTIEGKNGIIDGAFAYSPSGQPPANQYTFEGTVEDDSGGDISIGSSNGYSYIASVTTSGTIEASNGGAVTIFDPSAGSPARGTTPARSTSTPAARSALPPTRSAAPPPVIGRTPERST